MKNFFSRIGFFSNKSDINKSDKTKTIELSSKGPNSFSSHSAFGSSYNSGSKYPSGLANNGSINFINNRGVRQNARHAFHDTPEAKGIINRFADTVVDKGLKLECSPSHEVLGISSEDAEAWSRDVEERFDLWANSKRSDRKENLNFYQLQRLYHISQQRDNDIFIRFHYSKNKKLQNPLQLSLLDPNQIYGDSLTSTYADSTSNDGINRDSAGAEISYDIYIKDLKSGYKKVTVPKIGKKSGKRMMVHAFMPEYAGQNRGYSRLEHVLQEFNDLTDFKISNIKKAISQSQITMYVKPSTEEDSGNPFEDILKSGPKVSALGNVVEPNQVAADETCAVGYSEIPEANFSEPGSTAVFNLKKGQDLIPFNTQAAAESYDKFIESYMAYISSSTGMPIEILLMKFGENYSASRGALILFWGVVGIFRGEMSSDFLNPTFEAWLSGEIAAGKIQAPGFSDPVMREAWLNCKWAGSPMPNIDPMRTAKADMIYAEMGSTNLDRIARDLNGSSGRVNRQKLKRQYEELPFPKWNLNPVEEVNTEEEED